MLNWTVMTLDQRGQILSTTVAHGTSDASTTTRSYDELGRLETETRAAGAAEESTTVYGYNALGELETITYAAGTADECVTTRTYDAAGRLETETRADGTAEEVTTVYGYNAFGDMESTTVAAGTVDEQVTTRVHDALGRVESETVADGSAAEATTAYAYNAFGNVAKVTDPRLNSAYFYYDARDRLILQVDPEGYVTKSVYGLGGEPISVTRYATRMEGATLAAPPEIIADPDADATTAFHYDKLDRLTDITDAEQHSEHYELDAQGNRTQIVNKLGGVTDNVYDLLGRLKTQIVHANVHDGNGTLVATAIQTDFDYDKRGNLKTKTEAVGLGADVRVTSYAYDKLDQLIEIDRPDIVSVTVGLFMDPVTMEMKDSFTYDRRGNVIASQVAGAPKTYTYYDHLNRKTDEIDQSGMLSHWDYDANGNVKGHKVYGDAAPFAGTRPSAPPSPVNSANFRQTHYTYDKANRLETTFGAALTTARWDGDSYDFATGAIVRHVEYDAAGNAIRDYVGDVETRSFYDKLGRRIGQLDAEHYLTVWELDAEGNVLVETQHANRANGAIDQNASTQALHAAAGSSVDDRITVFTYDRNGRRETETRLEVAASTTAAGVLATTLHAASQIHYEYNGFGQVTRRVEANGDETLFTYDGFGRLTRTEAPGFAGHLGVSVRPTTDNLFDAFGNVVRTALNDPNGAAGDARVTSYVYNKMGWLASVTQQIDATLSASHSYTYDAGGRIVWDQYSRRKSNGSNSPDSIVYTYDVSGRLLSQSAATRTTTPPAVPKWGFGDVTRFKYNVFGEMIGRGINFGADNLPLYQETFDYDEGGRLWRSTEGGSGKIMFYDAQGNATLTLGSAGANVGALSFAAAKSSIEIQGGSGDTNIADAVTTIGVFDKRGLQIATIEPDRQLSSGAGTVTVTSSRTVNAFGETTSETDARNNTTLLFYNTMGRLIRKESPEVSWTDQNGNQANVHPTEHYFYDISGRLVAITDANGHTTRRNLLAGTGHDGADALVTVEYHADDRKVQTLYDVFKDARISRNEYWIDNSPNNDPVKTDVLMAYDKLGRLIQVQHLGRLLTETFTYDQLGQRTGHTMNALTETTDYDRQGRVIEQVAFGGDTTTYTYLWDGTITPGSLGNLGGWLKTTTLNAANVDSSVTLDYFNRTIARSDLGDHAYSHAYDWAGRMTSMAGPGETLTYTYLNSGRLASISNGAGNSTAFGYDKAGNETSEVTYKNSQLVQNATATWDALGRMSSWAEAGTTTLPAASILYEYDRVGNIRRQKASFQRLDGAGNPMGFLPSQDNWYLYDVMDRVTRDRGILVAVVNGELKTGDDARGIGTIERQQPGVLTLLNRLGEIGYDYEYDEAGRRVSMAMSKVRYEGGFPQNAFFREHKEMYDYFADGSLQQVRWVDGAETGFANSNTITVPAATGTGIRLSEFTRDAFGRTTSQTDWVTATVRGFSRTGILYNDKGQITNETVTTLASENNADALYVNTIVNNYGTGADYRLGAVVSSTSTVTRNNAAHSTATTTNTYEWRDAPTITEARIYTVRQAGGTTDYDTDYFYGASSELASVGIHDGRPRTVSFINDMAGQVIRRDETGGTSSGAPHEIWYRFGGKQMGQISNNGTLDNDYQQSLVYRQIWLGDSEGLGAFRFGGNTPKTYADFSQSQSPVNSYEQGGAGGSYIVRYGDTLQSIAASLWGNTDLWYKLAEANGLSGNSALVEGSSLTVPPGVVSNAHNADTFRPYDAAKALGDLSPSAQKPPPKPGGCGMIGQLIVMAIAIAITLLIRAPVAQFISTALKAAVGLSTAAAGAVGAVVGAAVTGAVASAVSQGVGVATGLTDKFSWKGVALSALSAGVAEGFAQAAGAIATSAAKAAAAANTTVSTAGKVAAYLASNAVGAQIIRSVVTDVASQGIAVATGLQKKFDWAGIAANAAAAGISAQVGKSLARAGVAVLDRRIAANFAGGIARAGTRAALTGTSFSDNIGAELPGVFANTIGFVIEDAMSRRSARAPAPAAAPAERPVERNILVDGAPELGIPSLRDYLRTHRPDGSLIEGPFDSLNADLRISLQNLDTSIAVSNMNIGVARRVASAGVPAPAGAPTAFPDDEGDIQIRTGGNMPLWMWSQWDSTHDWAEARERYIASWGARAYAIRVQSGVRLDALGFTNDSNYYHVVANQLNVVATVFARYPELPLHAEVAAILAGEVRDLDRSNSIRDYWTGVDPDPGMPPFEPEESLYSALGRNVREFFGDIGTVFDPRPSTSLSDRFNAFGRTLYRVGSVVVEPVREIGTGVAYLVDAEIYNDPRLARQGLKHLAIGTVEAFGPRVAGFASRSTSAALRPVTASLLSTPARHTLTAPTLTSLERAAGTVTTRLDAQAARAVREVRITPTNVRPSTAVSAPVSPRAVAIPEAGGRGAYFFGDDILPFIDRPNATLGVQGRSQFFMPLEDSLPIRDAATAYRYSGGAPTLETAYVGRGEVYGVDFPLAGFEPRIPTSADAIVPSTGLPFEHFLEGGHTGLRLFDNGGFLINPTREFVIPGGNVMPSGSVLFRLGPNGERIPLRRW
ncbi:MAG TPA: LysM peptidoglycan-binding domain-containing protein [Allosphingosinicella sp.]|nr:LysM peptidoglycan-binding domain-containing protein [Allosphingosinicella sp.]